MWIVIIAALLAFAESRCGGARVRTEERVGIPIFQCRRCKFSLAKRCQLETHNGIKAFHS